MLDAKTAITALEERLEVWEESYIDEMPEYGDVLKAAITALERQVPMPLDGAHPNQCPRCRRYFGANVKRAVDRFCPGCGQAILWEERT